VEIPQNAEQPCPQVGPGSESRRRFEGATTGILHQVLRIDLLSGQS
jgi:hypothetical protein